MAGWWKHWRAPLTTYMQRGTGRGRLEKPRCLSRAMVNPNSEPTLAVVNAQP